MSFYLVILERSAKSLFLVIFKAFRISILGVFVIFRRVQVFDFCISIAQSSQCKNEKSSKEYDGGNPGCISQRPNFVISMSLAYVKRVEILRVLVQCIC